MLNKKNISTGFTLIELLVVISIISMLSSVVLSSLSNARVKARDTKRVAELKQVQTAIEMYANDNGHYPITSTTWTCFDCSAYKDNDIYSPSSIDLATALSPYIKNLADPKPVSAIDGGYLYISPTGVDYCFMIFRTPENMNNFGSSIRNTTVRPSVNSIYIGTGQYVNGC